MQCLENSYNKEKCYVNDVSCKICLQTIKRNLFYITVMSDGCLGGFDNP